MGTLDNFDDTTAGAVLADDSTAATDDYSEWTNTVTTAIKESWEDELVSGAKSIATKIATGAESVATKVATGAESVATKVATGAESVATKVATDAKSVATEGASKVKDTFDTTTDATYVGKSSIEDSLKVSTQASNGQFAVEPSATVVSTNANGDVTTEYLWVAASETDSKADKKHDKTETLASSNVEESITSAIESATSTKSKNDKKNSKDESETSGASSKTGLYADEPLSTLVGTNSNGETYTSMVWWLPSSEMTKLVASKTSASDDKSSDNESSTSKEKADKKTKEKSKQSSSTEFTTHVTTIKSKYVTTEHDKAKTLTTTYIDTEISAFHTVKVAMIKNDTANAADKNGVALGVGAACIAAFLL
ncbi:hypothetical protein TBLA_0C05030 [Henningerozyma blattae CBS 6284]|uniref:Uncharacterized protein n=1 Tax=Henningerozyma blattae (strain ATCC 34711 / CBS 6284 / DSM 70876 / NBRC 10599 / NRRL Y-10934 / UCD 77-7) TaxID=1071380 RepID=I2H1P7_HENB6|nr:hypothetical protein TBLA_0C05030 [Tetrapisispora blattae CBS 6284]CCH60299.1 hypothetical protein TBLA_0C05030 [Tetrapisispora blattae CBS 6284]